MAKRPARFDAETVRQSWDRAVEGYAKGQDSGRDFYRYEFFGPAQVALCGDVAGRRLLDLGCGNGYFAREMASRGARVTATDISPRMIDEARRRQAAAPLGIDYHAIDAVDLPAHFAPESFDMATSCLALQDMADPARALRSVASLLPAGGRFVASIAHPFTDTPFREWERDSNGRKRWLCVDRYFDRGPIEYAWNWGTDFSTSAIHVPLEDWIDWILAAGFEIRALREPHPTEEALATRPALEDATRVPYFIIFDLRRRQSG